MCGRTVCALSPECIKRLCSKRIRRGEEEICICPLWYDDPAGNKYVPSYNLPPTVYSPVLLSRKQPHVSGLEFFPDQETVIQPMLWGLIPSWHSDNQKDFKKKMNNARSDSLLSKTSFQKPLKEGKRCVILCDGYYEWKTQCKEKLPYMIYFSENSDVYKSLKAEDLRNDNKIKSETGDITGKNYNNEAFLPKKLLTMAGLFDISVSQHTGERTYSFAIITVDAHDDYRFIHERMPAILNDDKEVADWLDFTRVPLEEAVKLIRPTNHLSYHMVSSDVNKPSCNVPQCILPHDHNVVKPKPLSKSGSFMMSWLKRPKGDDQDDSTQPLKKHKSS